jgi:DNA-directed RNA polymerase subunit RPC12/RpoP
MSDIHEFFQSDESGGFDYPRKPETLYDKQRTNLGKIAREGSILDIEPTIIKCSNCKSELCTIKITRPSVKIKSYIVAKCPHCGDKSFKQEFIGGFLIGGTDSTSIMEYPMETSYEGEFFVQNIIVITQKRKK